jgi:hypothetical protein
MRGRGFTCERQIKHRAGRDYWETDTEVSHCARRGGSSSPSEARRVNELSSGNGIISQIQLPFDAD